MWFIQTFGSCMPDSWENMAKVNINEADHVVLFTDYKREDVAQLAINTGNCAVLDSACSSTVCGKMWFDSYLQSLDLTIQRYN